MTDATSSTLPAAGGPPPPSADPAGYLSVHFRHFRTSMILLLAAITGILLWFLTYDTVFQFIVDTADETSARYLYGPGAWITVGVALHIVIAALSP